MEAPGLFLVIDETIRNSRVESVKTKIDDEFLSKCKHTLFSVVATAIKPLER